MSNFTFASARQIHVDFHTPDFVEVGRKFDARRFFDTLEVARVNCITVFATCHHGNSYYNTKVGVRHPGLEFDLLGKMAEGARQRGIELLAYFSLNVNEVQAARHPDWHAQFADGRSVNSQILLDGTELFWTWLCPNRAPWLDSFFHPHVQEVLDNYPVDGIFIDMAGYLPGSCFCSACVRAMREQGLNPDVSADHVAFNAATMQRFATALRRQMDAKQPGLRLELGCYNAFGQAAKGKGIISEFYLESLAYQTGWDYFPMAARYYRKFGVPTIGMTGRFLRNWGDFGTIVSPHQLKLQTGMHLLAGVGSAVGDHLSCTGELDKAVYDAIGEAFRFIEPRQPYCVGMTPAKEVAILVPTGVEGNAATKSESGDGRPVEDAYTGACKLMTELHYQYELLSPDESLDGYSLLVIGHGPLPAAFVARVETFVRQGGVALVTGYGLGLDGQSGVDAWHRLIGVTTATLSGHDGEFYEATARKAQSAELPAMPNYVHCRAIDAEFATDAKALAAAWRSPCVRTRDQHYGHFHGPALTPAGTAVAVRKLGDGCFILIRPQLTAAYLKTGYAAHRALVRNLLAACLPVARRVLRTNAPSLVEFSVGHKDGRTIVQALPFVSDRRHISSFESANEAITFHGIWVELPQVKELRRACDPISGKPLRTRLTRHGLRIGLPPFAEHQLVVVE